MAQHTLTAPSAWAPYLVNGDDSSLDAAEKAACDAWVQREGMGFPAACDDAGFCQWHDAFNDFPFAADCQDYVFLTRD